MTRENLRLGNGRVASLRELGAATVRRYATAVGDVMLDVGL